MENPYSRLFVCLCFDTTLVIRKPLAQKETGIRLLIDCREAASLEWSMAIINYIAFPDTALCGGGRGT